MSLNYRIGFLSAFLIFYIFNLGYGEPKFFSPDGRQISEKEYKSYIEKKDANSEATSSRNNSLENEKYGKPLNDTKSRFYLTKKGSNSEATGPINNSLENDKYGRPLHDSEGQRITYPDQEAQMVNPWRYDYPYYYSYPRYYYSYPHDHTPSCGCKSYSTSRVRPGVRYYSPGVRD